MRCAELQVPLLPALRRPLLPCVQKATWGSHWGIYPFEYPAVNAHAKMPWRGDGVHGYVGYVPPAHALHAVRGRLYQGLVLPVLPGKGAARLRPAMSLEGPAMELGRRSGSGRSLVLSCKP